MKIRLRYLRDIRNILILLMSISLLSPVFAHTQGVTGDKDSTEATIDKKDSRIVYLTEEQLTDLDHEEFGDWISVMPGYYPLDRGGYAQPFRMQFMGLSPSWQSLSLRGQVLKDHLTGSAEFASIPPESVSDVRFNPLSLQSSGAAIDAGLRVLSPVPPSSRIAMRDGFYGLGIVDFDLTEKISPAMVLNGGGRVSTYGGRLYNGEGYGLNLRGEVVWLDSNAVESKPGNIRGWGGIAQRHHIAGIPYKSITYNRERYALAAAMVWRQFIFQTQSYQQRETYSSGDEDAWDEIGLAATYKIGDSGLNAEFDLQGSAARWRLKTLDWSMTTFWGAQVLLNWSPLRSLRLESLSGLEWSDDFYPERHLGIGAVYNVNSSLSLFTNASQHQRQPSRFESSADFPPETHFPPYDPAFYQYSDLDLKGNRNLKNETCNRVTIGSGIDFKWISGTVALYRFQLEDPISWREMNGKIESYNAEDEEATGGLGWFTLRPFRGFSIGGSGSYLPLDSGRRRLFPEAIAHTWMQYRLLLFAEHLDLRFRLWDDFWGQRWFPVTGGWEKQGEDAILNARIGARLYGFYIFWGINNITDKDYELLPGFPMMHKEEILGISWNFVN